METRMKTQIASTQLDARTRTGSQPGPAGPRPRHGPGQRGPAGARVGAVARDGTMSDETGQRTADGHVS
jgi:hypothetical protein